MRPPDRTPTRRRRLALPARIGAALLGAAALLALFGSAGASAAAPANVTVGVFINDVQDLDIPTYSYAVDFYVWLRWTDRAIDPASTLELMNPYELWGMTRRNAYTTPRLLPDGSLYQVIRFQGRFSNKLVLDAYPFDTQQLTIVFEDDRYDDSTVEYVLDTDPISMDPGASLPGYDVGAPTIAVAVQTYPTDFGDTSATGDEAYSRVTVTVPVSRPALEYVVKLLVPIFLVAMVAALVFLLHASFVEARIGMGITALLTLVALQFTSSADLPKVDYLMMLDVLYLASYLFVLAVMAQAVAASWITRQGDEARAVALDRRMVVISGAGYALVVIAIFAYYLTR